MGAALFCRLQLVGAAVLFSTGGAAIKATSLDGWQVAAFRSAVAAVVLLTLLVPARRGWGRRTPLVGSAYAGTMVLFVLANKLTTAANAIFLQDTAPLYLLLAGPRLLGEPVRRGDVKFMVTLAVGVALVFAGRQPPLATAPDPLRGDLVALASGLTWALTIAGLRWMERSGEAASGLSAVAAGNLLAFLLALPNALPVSGATPQDWGIIAYLGVVQIGLAYVLLVRGVRGVPALETSLWLLVEPALNPLWAWWLHGERPAALAFLGGAVILAATAARAAASR